MTPLTWSIIGIIYFLPSLVAEYRGRQVASVFVLNLFLGWTLFGWVAALVMAVWATNAKKSPTTH